MINEVYETTCKDLSEKNHIEYKRRHNNGEVTPIPSKSFWDHFSKSYWEKDTYCKKNNFIKVPISESMIFDAVVKMFGKDYGNEIGWRMK